MQSRINLFTWKWKQLEGREGWLRSWSIMDFWKCVHSTGPWFCHSTPAEEKVGVKKGLSVMFSWSLSGEVGSPSPGNCCELLSVSGWAREEGTKVQFRAQNKHTNGWFVISTEKTTTSRFGSLFVGQRKQQQTSYMGSFGQSALVF